MHNALKVTALIKTSGPWKSLLSNSQSLHFHTHHNPVWTYSNRPVNQKPLMRVCVNIYSEAASPHLVCAAVLVSSSWDKNSMHLLKSEKDDGILSLTTSETVGSKWLAAGSTASFLLGWTSLYLDCSISYYQWWADRESNLSSKS